MSDKFEEIKSQLFTDIKLADIKYTAACRDNKVAVSESVLECMRGLIRVAIANGFAFHTAKMVTEQTSNTDPNDIFTKEEFLQLAGEVYTEIHDKCKELVITVQRQLALAEAKEAVKN